MTDDRDNGGDADLVQRRMRAKATVARLDAIEQALLVLMVRGASDQSIGAQLNLDPERVQDRKNTLIKKLNAGAIAEAVRIALLAGMDETADCTSLH